MPHPDVPFKIFVYLFRPDIAVFGLPCGARWCCDSWYCYWWSEIILINQCLLFWCWFQIIHSTFKNFYDHGCIILNQSDVIKFKMHFNIFFFQNEFWYIQNINHDDQTIIQFDNDVFSLWKSQFYFIDNNDCRFLFVQFCKEIFIQRNVFCCIWINNSVFSNIFCFHWNVSDVFGCHRHSRWFGDWIIVLRDVCNLCGISVCRFIAIGFELFFNSFLVFINI